MAVSSDVNYEELARSTDEFNGAQLKAVCVEAGMIALREGATKLGHEHFLSGIAEGMLHFSADVLRFAHNLLVTSTKQEEERFDVLCIDSLYHTILFSLVLAYTFMVHIQIWPDEVFDLCMDNWTTDRARLQSLQ